MTEERKPEDIERSEQLFKKLAAEEPPLSRLDDTAPARTAPRPAVQIEPRRRSSRYLILGVMAILLVGTVLVTLLVFFSESDDETPVAITPEPEAAVTATTTQPEVLPENPEPETPDSEVAVQPTSTAVPATPIPIPTRPAFNPTMLPTAAADEIAVALQAPVSETGQLMNVDLRNNPFTITGSTGRTTVEAYTIKQGDTLSSIAGYYGLDICTLIWSNPRSEVNPPRTGAVIDILPVDGVFYRIQRNSTIQEIADRLQADPYAIIEFASNDLLNATPETVLLEDMKVVVPGGNYGECIIWSPPVITTGPAGSSDGSGGNGSRSGGTLWGCPYEVANTGYPQLRPLQSSYKFYQAFSAVHSGVDLSAASGTPVYAAGGGTVAFANWNEWGYGNAIVIDHGTGFYTLYAHLSSINVSCGQSVNQGDMIGGVGSTGRSSGPHLHFEIRNANFDAVDPLSYIGM